MKWLKQIYLEKFEKHLSLFFKKHSIWGFVGFILSMGNIIIAISLLLIEEFLPEWKLLINILKIVLYMGSLLTMLLALLGLVEKNKKRLFGYITFIISFIPLLFLDSTVARGLFIVLLKLIVVFIIIVAIRWFLIKYKEYFFTKSTYLFLGGCLLFFGFQKGFIQAIFNGIIGLFKGIFLLIALLFSPITGYDPLNLTPNERFESYLNMPVPKEVVGIKTISASAPIGPGGFYYQLEYKASPSFFDILAKHNKFPYKNSKNIEIHLVSCEDFRVQSRDDRCYFGVIYPYFHNIIYHPQSREVEHSIGEYFE